MVNECRRLRSEMNLSPAEKIPLAISGDKKIIELFSPYLKALVKLSDIETHDDLPQKEAPVALFGDFKLMLNIEFNIAEEMERIEKEINRLTIEITKAESKLNNKSFTDKAPKAVVNQEKERLTNFSQAKQKFEKQLLKIKN